MDICTVTGIASSCLLPAPQVVRGQVPQTGPRCCQLETGVLLNVANYGMMEIENNFSVDVIFDRHG